MRINSLTIGSFSVTAQLTSGVGANNIIELVGLESPPRRVSSFSLPGNHGAFVSNALYGGRVLGIKIQILGSTETNLRERVTELAAELDLSGDSFKVTTTFVDVDGNSFSVIGVPRIMSMGGGFGQRRFDEVNIEILSEDYRIISSTTNQTTIFLQSAGGLSIPTPVPASFGSGVGGSATLTNAGNTDACPVIRLNGPLTNPTVANQTTDKQFKYDAIIGAGDFVDVDTSAKTVVNSGGVSVLGNASTSIRDFWCLQPGANVVTLAHEGVFNVDGNTRITWNDSYLSL